MSQTIQLQIAEPCHENWNLMTPQQQGRFCGSCQKIVVDFTSMTDGQLFDYFKNYSGNTCGRFENVQLDKKLQAPAAPKHGWYKWGVAMLLSGFLFSSKAKAQGLVMLKSNTKKTASPAKEKAPVLPEKLFQIRGKVVDENGNGIPYASVQERGGAYGASADSLGNFVLNLKSAASLLPITVSSVGYVEQATDIDLALGAVENQVFTLLPKSDLEQVVVNGYRYEKRCYVGGAVSVIAGGISVMRSTDESGLKKTSVVSEPTFTLYPNPAKPGAAITLQFKQAANYSISLIDANGRRLYSQSIGQQTKEGKYAFAIPANLGAGQYFVQIIDAKTRKQHNEKLMIIR